MKKTIIGLMLVGFCCSGSTWGADNTLLVFAGAGLRVPLDEIAAQFQAENDIRVVYDYEGDGRLGNKILAGQKPDLFIPGGEKWAQQLKKQGQIKSISPLAYHIPVILTPLHDTKVNALQDFTNNGVRLALGDPGACAIGRASQQVLEKAGLSEDELNVVARGATVKQLVHWVEFNNADATISWHADGVQSNKVRIIPIPSEFTHFETIPACEMTDAPHPDLATQYMTYLLDHGAAVFKRHGFGNME